MTDNIVTKARLAALLGVGRNVVSNWVARGKSGSRRSSRTAELMLRSPSLSSPTEWIS
jgi:hypothetical protein